MKTRPQLLFINGPAGIGKSTIAKLYIDDHPLALVVEADEIIACMGQWLAHEKQGRKLSFELLKVMTNQHLSQGYDVVVPHLLTNNSEADELEQIAHENGAVFAEFVLVAPKDESVSRMMARGTWGEPGSPPLQDSDVAIVEDLYDKMTATLENRPRAIHIVSHEDDSQGAYASLLSHLSSDEPR